MNPNSKQGKEAYVLKERLVAKSETESREAVVSCDRTMAVAAAMSAGVAILPKGFERVIDSQNHDHTMAVFALDNRQDVEMDAFPGEVVSTGDIVKRMGDINWLKANPNHPIAWMNWALRNYVALAKAIRLHKPLVHFIRGNRHAYVVVGGDQAENDFILERAGFSEDERMKILREVC